GGITGGDPPRCVIVAGGIAGDVNHAVKQGAGVCSLLLSGPNRLQPVPDLRTGISLSSDPAAFRRHRPDWLDDRTPNRTAARVSTEIEPAGRLLHRYHQVLVRRSRPHDVRLGWIGIRDFLIPRHRL